MRRSNAILVLLLAICLVAVPVLPPAANAVPTSSSAAGSAGGAATTVAGASGDEDDSGRGDPGGAGDGLGVDLENPVVGTIQSSGSGLFVELVLQVLRLMQAAG